MDVDGEVGALRACIALKQTNDKLRVIFSIGGRMSATTFPTVAASEEKRANAARSARELVDEFELDGIDGMLRRSDLIAEATSSIPSFSDTAQSSGTIPSQHTRVVITFHFFAKCALHFLRPVTR